MVAEQCELSPDPRRMVGHRGARSHRQSGDRDAGLRSTGTPKPTKTRRGASPGNRRPRSRAPLPAKLSGASGSRRHLPGREDHLARGPRSLETDPHRVGVPIRGACTRRDILRRLLPSVCRLDDLRRGAQPPLRSPFAPWLPARTPPGGLGASGLIVAAASGRKNGCPGTSVPAQPRYACLSHEAHR